MCQSLPVDILAQVSALGTRLVQLAQAQANQPLAALETAVRQVVQSAVAGLLGAVVGLATAELDAGIATVHRSCPGCGQRVRMQSARPRTLHTSCGVLTYTRPWYHCPRCRQGFAPADAQLAVAPHARISASLEDWLVRLTVSTTQREAAAVLRELTGLVVGMDTMREHTTVVGSALAAADDAARAQVQTTREAAEPVDPAAGMLVVETDGVMVRYHDGWHEVRIGVVGGAVDGDLTALSYVAAREPAEAFGPRLLAEAARRGALAVVGWQGGLRGHALAQLRPVHVVGDGAPWIWNLAAEHFGKRTEVLDFFHAAEHVWEVARAVYGSDSDEARVGATLVVRAMRRGGAAPVRAALAAVAATHPPPEAAEVVRRARGYFATNADRMDYAALVAAGLPIGSGAVESSAGHVVQHRMKRPGQRWSERGGRAMLALRGRAASGRPLSLAA